MELSAQESTKTEKSLDFLSGGGEMGELIRSYNWENTPLGNPRNWPQNLKTCVRIMLSSRQPIWLGWGKELIKLYNDPYIDIVRGKHPIALGQPASVVWRDIWKEIEPMLHQVMEEDTGTYVESQLLIMERNGYPEETYYTFSYTPIPGDDGTTAGMICFNTDDTERILGERQLRTLKDLSNTTIEEKSESEFFKETIDILHRNAHDFPYAMIYRLDESGSFASLESATIEHGKIRRSIPVEISLEDNGPLQELFSGILSGQKMEIWSNIHELFGEMPKGPWDRSSEQAVVMPIMQIGQERPFAILIAGMNPYRLPDDKYLHFFNLVTDHISTSISNIRAFREEKRRTQALIELDRAKTTFFNNISHEFRTPLTLMLGPLEELLSNPERLSDANKERLETTHRNARRLLRLVNTLLDFSRIESGRTDAHFQPVNLCSLTADLASNFRSIVETAGLRLEIGCNEDTPKVYIDKSMWEKIVLNLLSNAFKYTMQGGINIALREENNYAVMEVKDTGVGIPEKEIPHMFERFHRVKNSVGRSFEGTGIGLSLVYELVKIHGGDISVKSTLGEGSIFTVRIPLGKTHLPENQVVEIEGTSAAGLSDIFIDEAASFVNSSAGRQDSLAEMPQYEHRASRILVVDDNADMRGYIVSLLQNEYMVDVAADGIEALEKMKTLQPDLILSDIMMPRMDGLELLKTVKEHPALMRIPVILLSARAGEEARIEGLDIGADDYLVKPFTSKELRARVRSQVNLLIKRNHLEGQLKALFEQAPVAISILRGPEHIVELANERMLELWGKSEEQVLFRPLFKGLYDAAGQGFEEILHNVFTIGERFVGDEVSINLTRNGRNERVFVKFVYEPLREEDGSISGIVAIALEITDLVVSRRKVEESEARLRMAVEATRMGTWEYNPSSGELSWSKECREIYAFPPELTVDFQVFSDHIYPDDKEKVLKAIYLAMEPGGGEYDITFRILQYKTGEVRWIRSQGKVYFNEEGETERFVGTVIDITEQWLFEDTLREGEQRLRLAIEGAALGTFDWDIAHKKFYSSPRLIEMFGYGRQMDTSHQDLLNAFHPEDKYVRDKAVQDSFEHGGLMYEARVIWPDGSVHWLRMNGKVVFDADGKPSKMYGTAMDITDQKTQAGLLERKVEERTVELRETIADLARSNSDLEQFAYVASHDLNEPIRMVANYTSLLSKRYRMTIPSEGTEYMDFILEGTSRMQHLIKDLLQYSRIGNARDSMAKVDCNVVIEIVTQNLRNVILTSGAIIKADSLPVITGVESQLVQLFQNLIENAIKFRSGRNPEIEISVKDAGKEWTFTVSDNGIGISPEYFEKIFVIFQRLHTRDQYEGTGIGLSVCKRIVELHGGKIWVDSIPGEGTAFSFTILKKGQN